MSDVHDKQPSQPSWLRLELYALGELSPREADEVAAGLAHSEESRQCLERIQSDARTLPRLPAPDSAPGGLLAWWRRVRARTWFGWTAMATATAALLLALVLQRQGTDGREHEPVTATTSRIRVKGGDVVIDLVRERNGAVSHEPLDFAPGDRFKVLVTCPDSMRLRGKVEVQQGGESSFPLSPADEACGNRVALPGAFRITGHAPVAVCFTFDGPMAQGRGASGSTVCAHLDAAR